MKNKFKILFAFIGLAMLFTACTPDAYKLGTVLDKSVLKYSIIPDAKDPNKIILKSLTPGLTPQWITPLGKSIKVNDTVKIAFPGKYNFIYGVECSGGLVQADTFKITITTTNLSYVNDPLWTNLTGGVGKSKTWVPDNGKYGYAAGFMSYADPTVVQGFESFKINWDPGNSNTGATTSDLSGTMTFDLINGPHLNVVKPNESGAVTTGSYYLDVNNHTLTTNDVSVLRIATRISEVTNWGNNIKVLELTSSRLVIAFMRTDPVQGPWWDVYNYVSKDYAGSYVGVEPQPTLPADWQTAISQNTSTAIKWVLSPSTPFNWANLDGSSMNSTWTTAADYPSWTGFSASVAASYANFSLTLNSADSSAVYVDPSGNSTKGTYLLDTKGFYTFAGVTPNFIISGGWVALTTSAKNQWRITSIEKSPTGAISGMWVGVRDAVSPQYMVYHLIPQIASASDPLKPFKTALVGKTFKIDLGRFVDWTNFSGAGGWTSSSTFGTDYTSNGWIWTASTSAVAASASLSFAASTSGSEVIATLTQDMYKADGTLVTAGYTVSGKVIIDPTIPSLTFDFPLVNFTGSTANWLPINNAMGKYFSIPLATNEWLLDLVSGTSLSTIDTNGMSLGAVDASLAAPGGAKNEVLSFFWKVSK